MQPCCSAAQRPLPLTSGRLGYGATGSQPGWHLAPGHYLRLQLPLAESHPCRCSSPGSVSQVRQGRTATQPSDGHLDRWRSVNTRAPRARKRHYICRAAGRQCAPGQSPGLQDQYEMRSSPALVSGVGGGPEGAWWAGRQGRHTRESVIFVFSATFGNNCGTGSRVCLATSFSDTARSRA